jgi:hypothetical protein
VAISIKSITVGTATPGQVSVTTSETPTATAAGDIVVVFHGNNFYAATNMVAPTATGSPTVTAITGTGLPADGGTNLAHIKAYWYQANTAGAQTISETETGTHDEEKYLIAVVLSGADTSTPIDAAAGSTGASSASFVAPAVSPTTSDAFLIAVASDGGGAMGGPFTTPATYTEDADFAVGASNLSGVVAHKQLAASGSTGTITFTATTAEPWAAVTLAIKTGGAAGPAAQPWTRFNPGAALKRRLLVRQTGLLKEASKVAAPPVTWFTSLADGVTPSLLVSAEDWAILCNGGLNHAGDFAATYDDYFAKRQAQGYNSILVSLFSGTFFSGGANGPDSDGTYPFNTNSTDPLNPANTTFWARRDAFLTTAATYGFRVMLNASTPFVHVGSFTASWTTAQWAALGTFLGNRYAAQSNILWMMGDDYFDDTESGFDAFFNALRAAGAVQPISIQNYQETTSRADIFNGTARPWGAGHAQYNFGYSYNVTYDVVEKMGNEANPLPYFWADGTFLNTGGLSGITDVQLMRRQIWWALSSGSKGFQVGDNDIWTWDSTALGFVTSKSFYTAVVPAIAAAFRALPNWHLLKADTSNLLVTAGRGTHASPLTSGGSGGQYLSDTDSYVTASFIQSGTHAGELAVIYMSHGSTITIDESKMVAGYTATWLDPKSGATSSATPGTTYNSTAKGTNSDGQADWVLVLKAPSASGDATVTPSVVNAATTVAAPSVSTGETVAASVVNATTTVPTPTITSAATVAAAVVAALASIATPTVTSSATVTPSVVAAVASVPTPTVTTAGNATATPAVVTAVTTVPTPTVATGETVSASVVTATTAIPTPTVTAGGSATVTPAVVAAVTAVGAATVATGVTVAPSVVAAAASIPAPAITSSATATPSVVATLTTVPAPVVATGETVAPSVVNATTSIPAPSVSAGGNATAAPPVVALSTTVPAPAVSVGSRVSPAVVSAVTAVGSPTVTSRATVTPTVVAATTTIPTPTVIVTGNINVHPGVVTAVVTIPAPTPAGIYQPAARERTLYVAAELRRLAVAHENRINRVAAENRTLSIPED